MKKGATSIQQVNVPSKYFVEGGAIDVNPTVMAMALVEPNNVSSNYGDHGESTRRVVEGHFFPFVQEMTAKPSQDH
jgi:hypothetical protein